MPIKPSPNPTHPGVALEVIYLEGRGWSQSELARQIGCSHRKVNEIINGKRGITPDFALDLERVLGTTAEMWLNMQSAWDLAEARKKLDKANRPARKVSTAKRKSA